MMDLCALDDSFSLHHIRCYPLGPIFLAYVSLSEGRCMFIPSPKLTNARQLIERDRALGGPVLVCGLLSNTV